MCIVHEIDRISGCNSVFINRHVSIIYALRMTLTSSHCKNMDHAKRNFEEHFSGKLFFCCPYFYHAALFFLS